MHIRHNSPAMQINVGKMNQLIINEIHFRPIII